MYVTLILCSADAKKKEIDLFYVNSPPPAVCLVQKLLKTLMIALKFEGGKKGQKSFVVFLGCNTPKRTQALVMHDKELWYYKQWPGALSG